MCPILPLTTTHQRDGMWIVSNCDRKTPPFGTCQLPSSPAGGHETPFSDDAVGLIFLGWLLSCVVLLLSAVLDPMLAFFSPVEMRRTNQADGSGGDSRGHALDKRRLLPPTEGPRSGFCATVSLWELDSESFDVLPPPEKLSAMRPE